MNRVLDVLWDGVRVGTLALDAHGEMIFGYAPTWVDDPAKPAISASLPKQKEPFGRRQSRPFFAGLLPEETQRDAVARALGVSKGNDFALLDALGGDVAGALVLWPEGSAPPAPPAQFRPRALDDTALAALLDELPKRPFLAGDAELRLSLAGAQPKLPVVLIEGQVALPAAGQPTTHILKPQIARFEGTTENEAFCLRLAAAVGLSAAPVAPRRTGDKTYLLVERYDRAFAADGTVRRLHQEDFCQALGIAPERKYASEGGPNFKTSFDLVRLICARPAIDVLRLLDAAIFNALIGNADAHGKNFSLLYLDNGPTLTPLYDLMATILYPEVASKLAMKIAKMSAIEDLDARIWGKFADEVGLSAPFVRRRVLELSRLVIEQCAAVSARLAEEGFAGPTLNLLKQVIASRAEVLRDLLS
jgi:serine/threonine-protein kinase HipA